MTAVYLNAMNVVCALGQDASAVRAALFAPAFRGVAPTDRYSPGRMLALGRVPDPLPELAHLPEPLRSRNNALLLLCARALHTQVDALVERYGPGRVGVVLGVSTAGLDEGEQALQFHLQQGSWPANFDYAKQEMGNPAQCLAHALGVQGPVYAISTACSSGPKAMAASARLVRAGVVDAMVTGGVDALCRFTVQGFGALASVSDARCNPLSAHRDGINLGEGAGLFVMSREDGPVRLAGAGESSDAHHMSAPDPSAQGAIMAIEQALHRAGVAGSAIDYVNLHGTATPHNDAMECLAVARTVGLAVPVSSTKPLTGHALAAAGAIEAALAWLTLVDNPQGQLPPHWWDGVPDAALAPVRVVRPHEKLGRPVRHVLSNSFAFGGSNAALVLSA